MIDRQARNRDWDVADETGNITWECVAIAVQMDIRNELRRIRRTLDCTNFHAIPEIMRAIRRNTAKPKKRQAIR